jgi:hypothetical protein
VKLKDLLSLEDFEDAARRVPPLSLAIPIAARG